MKISGGCHCGELKYKATIDPTKVIICHCNDCQRLSGSTFRSVVLSLPDAMTFTKGTPKIYVKIAESGNERAQGFCQHCGSAMYATSIDTVNKVYGIRLGSVDQKHELTPKSQIWCNAAAPWLDTLNTLPAFDTVPIK